LVDDERKVSWQATYMSPIVDLDRDHDHLLLDDLRRDAVSIFETQFFEQQTLRDNERKANRKWWRKILGGSANKVLELPPRTSDPNWSPVVSLAHTNVMRSASLDVIHRLTYARGDELVVGQIIIPLEAGTLYVSAWSRAGTTGIREALLTERVIAETATSDLDEEAIFRLGPSQDEIDDPALDEDFLEHPLSLVRNALKWFHESGLVIEVSRPFIKLVDPHAVLPNVGCEITPPHRFVSWPTISADLSSTLAFFTRSTLPMVEPQLFDVWRIPDLLIGEKGSQENLRRVAFEATQGWTKEGATDIDMETWPLPQREGRIGVGSYTRFSTVNGPTQSAAHWIADNDGTVFRITAGGPMYLKKEELVQRINQAADTWRRLK